MYGPSHPYDPSLTDCDQKFTALHEEFHKQSTYVETLKKDKQNLEEQVKSVSDARNAADEKAKELKNQLDQASAEYQKKVKALNDFIEHLKKDDKFDHQVIKKLQEEVNHYHQQIITLNAKLSQAQIDKKALGTVILGLKSKIAELDGKRIKLQNELSGQKAQNVTLRSDIISLKRKLSETLDANGHLQKELRLSEGALKDTKDKYDDAKDKLGKEELAHQTTKAALKTAQDTAADLDKQLKAAKLETSKAERKTTEANERYDYKVSQADNYHHKIEKYEAVTKTFKEILIDDDINNEKLNAIDKTFKELRENTFVRN